MSKAQDEAIRSIGKFATYLRSSSNPNDPNMGLYSAINWIVAAINFKGELRNGAIREAAEILGESE